MRSLSPTAEAILAKAPVAAAAIVAVIAAACATPTEVVVKSPDLISVRYDIDAHDYWVLGGIVEAGRAATQHCAQYGKHPELVSNQSVSGRGGRRHGGGHLNVATFRCR